MSHRSRMERQARIVPARQGSVGGSAKTPGNAYASANRKEGPPGLSLIQQAYGNQALERMVQAAMRKDQKPQAAEGLREPYASLAARMEEAAQRAGKNELLAMYAKLMPAQKMAVLRAMDGIGADVVNWETLEAKIQGVQGVKLEEDEVEAEADVSEPGSDAAAGSAADAAGLLAPYWEVVRWLHYKAGKQGKSDLIRSFNALSIPQMKIALHRMSGMSQMGVDAFAEAMTVTIQLKQWVDWDAVAAAVRAAGRIKDEDGASDPAAYLTIAGETGLEEEASEEDAGWGFAGAIAAAGILGLGSEGEEADRDREPPYAGKADAIRARLESPGQIGWLLLGLTAGVDGADAIARYCRQSGGREAVVDRCLQLPAAADPKARAEQRSKLLMQLGFGHTDQCYGRIMNELAAIVYEQGVQGTDPAYRKLLDELGIPRMNGQSPTKDMVLKKLAAV
jgi:hypothetical protein